MEFINSIIGFVNSPTGTSVFVALFILSEALASIPSIKSNSVFQLVQSLLQKLSKKEDSTVPSGPK